MSIEQEREKNQGTQIAQTVKGTKVQDLSKQLEEAKKDLSNAQIEVGLLKNKQISQKKRLSELSRKHERVEKTKQKINQIKREIKQQKTPGITRTPEPAKRSALTRPKIVYADVIQGFYDKGNFPSPAQMNKALREKGINARRSFPPKSVGEALNRAAYAITETIGGGVREATFGLSGSMGVEKRPGGEVYQVAGGLATPSVADYAAGYALTKISGKTKTVIKKLSKYMYPDEMWANPQIAAKIAKEAERVPGRGGLSVLEIREGQKAILPKREASKLRGLLTKEELTAFNKVAKAFDETPSKAFKGLSASELREAHKIAEKLDIKIPKTKLSKTEEKILAMLAEAEEGRGGLSIADIRKGMNSAEKISKTGGPIEDILSASEYKLIKDELGEIGFTVEDIEKADKKKLKTWMDQITEYYEKNPDKPRIQQVTEIYDEWLSESWDDDIYANFLKKYDGKIDPDLAVSIFFNLSPKDRAKILEDVADYNLNKPVPGLSDKPTPIEKPTDENIPSDTPEDDTKEIPVPFPPEEIQKTDTPTIPDLEMEPLLEEEPFEDEPTEPPPPETPPLILPEREKEKRKQINIQLYHGKKEKYRVKYSYKGNKNEIIIVEANSLIKALGTAQRLRKPSKTQPRVIDIKKVS